MAGRVCRPKDKAGAARLRAMREQMGWSREQLGQMAGVSGKWIGHIEDTGHAPHYTVQSRLAKPFRMIPSDIWKVRDSVLSPAEQDRLRELALS